LTLDFVQAADHRIIGIRRPSLGEVTDALSSVGDDSGERRDLGGVGVHPAVCRKPSGERQARR